MKQDRLKEYEGYGYTTIGETENDETIVAKRFESGVVLIMTVHDRYISQLRLEKGHMDKIIELYHLPQAIETTAIAQAEGKIITEDMVNGNDCKSGECS